MEMQQEKEMFILTAYSHSVIDGGMLGDWFGRRRIVVRGRRRVVEILEAGLPRSTTRSESNRSAFAKFLEGTSDKLLVSVPYGTDGMTYAVASTEMLEVDRGLC